jgi:hypothetical protein
VPSLSSVVSLPVSGLLGLEGIAPPVEGGPDIPNPFFGLVADLFLGVRDEYAKPFPPFDFGVLTGVSTSSSLGGPAIENNFGEAFALFDSGAILAPELGERTMLRGGLCFEMGAVSLSGVGSGEGAVSWSGVERGGGIDSVEGEGPPAALLGEGCERQ